MFVICIDAQKKQPKYSCSSGNSLNLYLELECYFLYCKVEGEHLRTAVMRASARTQFGKKTEKKGGDYSRNKISTVGELIMEPFR